MSDSAAQAAVGVVKSELRFQDLQDGGFRCRLRGVQGAFVLLGPVSVVLVAVLIALTVKLWAAFPVLGLGLAITRRGGHPVQGITVASGKLALDGLDVAVPLHEIRAIELTQTGFTVQRERDEPIDLQLSQSIGACAWLAERIRQEVLAHGDYDDVPQTMARLRGESVVAPQ